MSHRFPAGPPTPAETLRACDPEQAVAGVSEVFCPHTLRLVRSDVPFDLAMTKHAFDALKMVDLTYNAPVRVVPDPFGSFLLITTAVAGGGTVRVGRREEVWRANRTLLLAPDSQHDMAFGPGFRQTTVRISRHAFTRAWAAWTGSPLRSGLPFAPVALPDDVQRHWTQLVSLLRSLFEARRMTAVLAANLTDATAGLMISTTDVVLDAGPAGRAPAAPAYLRRAEEFIAAYASEPITTEEIAAAAGCGYRSLQLAFQRHRGTTPKRFLSDVRLSLARAALLSGSGSSGITDVALRHGFAHLGRFTQLYQERYGEMPSATLRAIRSRR